MGYLAGGAAVAPCLALAVPPACLGAMLGLPSELPICRCGGLYAG